MSAGYSDIVLWAVFLFLSYIGYGAAAVHSLNRLEFNNFRQIAACGNSRGKLLSISWFSQHAAEAKIPEGLIRIVLSQWTE